MHRRRQLNGRESIISQHVFGAQQSAPGGRIVRTFGMVGARANIGLQNLACNIRRLGEAGTARRGEAEVPLQCNRSSRVKKEP